MTCEAARRSSADRRRDHCRALPLKLSNGALDVAGPFTDRVGGEKPQEHSWTAGPQRDTGGSAVSCHESICWGRKSNAQANHKDCPDDICRQAACGMSIGAGAAAEEMSSYAPVTQQRLENPEAGNWLLYRRTYDSHGFSPLRQINTDTVKDLVPVWTFSTGRSKATRRRRWSTTA